MKVADPLAAKEPNISLKNWWRPKSELTGEHILDLHLPGGQNMTPNEYYCDSISAGDKFAISHVWFSDLVVHLGNFLGSSEPIFIECWCVVVQLR